MQVLGPLKWADLSPYYVLNSLVLCMQVLFGWKMNDMFEEEECKASSENGVWVLFNPDWHIAPEANNWTQQEGCFQMWTKNVSLPLRRWPL